MEVPKNDAINPEMVVLARESRGVTQSELAELVGATQGYISKIESGTTQPQDDVVESMAQALGYPVSFFRQVDKIYGASVSEFFHRKRSDVTARTLAKLHAQINIRRFHIDRLMRAAEIPDRMPRIDPDEFGGDIEEIARAVRARWQMPRGPVKNVIRSIEDAGGVVVRMKFDTAKVDAVSWWIPGSAPIFVVNDAIPADRERLTLCHELGHLIMHKDVRANIEEEANRFAGAFLMPAEDIRPHLRDVSLRTLAGLKPHWRVSMQSLLYRAQHAGWTDEKRAKYIWTQIGRAGYRTHEPAELDFPKEAPGLVQELIDLHCGELGYDLKQLSGMFNWLEEEVLATYSIKNHQTGNRAGLRVLK